jgi:hypothetical protein
MLDLHFDVVGGALAYDKKHLRATMRGAGMEVAAVTRKYIRGGPKTGRFYYRKGGGRYQASAPGQPPANRSGVLAGNVRVFVASDAESVKIREMARYGWLMEHGRNSPLRQPFRKGKRVGVAIQLAPRPYLTRALNERIGPIQVRIAQAVYQDTKFVRQRP